MSPSASLTISAVPFSKSNRSLPHSPSLSTRYSQTAAVIASPFFWHSVCRRKIVCAGLPFNAFAALTGRTGLSGTPIKKMRARDPELSANWGTICTPVQMPAADGKMRKIQAANTEGLLRIIQSIPSPKAEPFKRWLAQVGRERIEETIDPEQAIDRALETYQKRDMIQTGFISGFFLSVSVMSLPLNGRSEAYSRAKNI